jgi:hypothetical protein
MGEQPNPWDLLQPQDATSRHRTFTPLSLAAQTMSSPCLTKGEGSACCGVLRFGSSSWLGLVNATGSKRSQSLRGHALAVAVGLPYVRTSHGVAFLHIPGRAWLWREGFAVISRCFEQRFRCSHPKLRCQTVPSIWTLGNDQPVIPRVPFSR